MQELLEFQRGVVEVAGLNSRSTKGQLCDDIGEAEGRIGDTEIYAITLLLEMGRPKKNEQSSDISTTSPQGPEGVRVGKLVTPSAPWAGAVNPPAGSRLRRNCTVDMGWALGNNLRSTEKQRAMSLRDEQWNRGEATSQNQHQAWKAATRRNANDISNDTWPSLKKCDWEMVDKDATWQDELCQSMGVFSPRKSTWIRECPSRSHRRCPPKT